MLSEEAEELSEDDFEDADSEQPADSAVTAMRRTSRVFMLLASCKSAAGVHTPFGPRRNRRRRPRLLRHASVLGMLLSLARRHARSSREWRNWQTRWT